MDKLTIGEASKQFGISRARLYKLLQGQIVKGYRSKQRGPKANSWIDGDSLKLHIENRLEKQQENGRKTKIVAEGEYLPSHEAAHKVGYTVQNVDLLAREGKIKTKQTKYGKLVYYPSLLKYFNSRKRF